MQQNSLWAVPLFVWLACPLAAQGEIINVTGFHECPFDSIWNGETCSFWFGWDGNEWLQEPVCYEEPVCEAPDTPWGDPGAPAVSEECLGCASKSSRCVSLAAEFARDLRRHYSELANRQCSPPHELAKGGRPLVDLKSGKLTIAPYVAEDWQDSCFLMEVAGHPKKVCFDQAFALCQQSYRSDLPEFQHLEALEASVEVSFEKVFGGSVTGKETFSYSYGGALGWSSSVEQLQKQLLLSCAQKRIECMAEHDCEVPE